MAAVTDREAGFEILDERVRSRKSEIFYEAYRRPLNHWRTVEGFTQQDYAFRIAAWHATAVFAELKEGEDRDCSICIRVCPYNKDYSHWIFRAGRRLTGTRLRRFMLWLDIRFGYGARLTPSARWRNSNSKEPTR